jgi:hypothetical protein
MNLYTDKRVRCPFFREHVVSEKQLKWHISRKDCEKKWLDAHPGS